MGRREERKATGEDYYIYCKTCGKKLTDEREDKKRKEIKKEFVQPVERREREPLLKYNSKYEVTPCCSSGAVLAWFGGTQ